MGNSLFEQLKKTGLVDEKKAKKAKHSQYKNKKQKAKKGTAAPVDEATLHVQKSQAEKVEKDRQLNQQKKAEAEHKAIAAQIKQLIDSNRIQDSDGNVVYNFTDANVVKRLHLSEKAHKHLVSGSLAIVKRGEGYELVPFPVAEKIKQRDEHSVILSEQTSESESLENDEYADYKIPDDLMW
ncbi:MAG: DUF2058 domain-containing protein [Ectothiorhodospiraceae bacterium]|nr:DUF2058 domain-containing protein [Ectothiorhodospiraceae bacterium]